MFVLLTVDQRRGACLCYAYHAIGCLGDLKLDCQTLAHQTVHALAAVSRQWMTILDVIKYGCTFAGMWLTLPLGAYYHSLIVSLRRLTS